MYIYICMTPRPCTSLPRLPYNAYYGGVVSFTREQYRNINGNSNLFFGWGGEDDDLKTR